MTRLGRSALGLDAESGATKSVMRNLQKDRPDTFEPVGYSFSTESLEIYTRQAKTWLGDHSELSEQTINSADYSVALEHFHQ